MSDIFLTGVISILVTIITEFLLDVGHKPFTAFRTKIKVLERAPDILAGKAVDISSEDVATKVFTMKIQSDLVEDGGNPEEKLSADFKLVNSADEISSDYNFGFRIHNHSNDGISLTAIMTKSNQYVELSNWNNRHIDPQKTVTVFYSLRDCPTEIRATFVQKQIKYIIPLPSQYVHPEYINVHGDSRSSKSKKNK